MVSEKWQPYRSIITEKYMVQNLPIHEIMHYMQTEKSFFASKSAYERQLRAWGCHKNFTEAMWKFVRLRIHEREAKGKKSDVYFYGNLVDRGKTQNHISRVHTTYVESRILQRPATPDNVAIILPVSPSYLFIIKSDRLPWHHFCELVELQSVDISFQLPGDIRRTMALYLAPKPITTNDVSTIVNGIVEYFGAILPLDQDDDIFDHLKLAFADASQRSTWEFLKLTVYLLSNKLLLSDSPLMQRFRSGAKIISDEILKWFLIGHNRIFCRAILAVKAPSIDSFAENIFCSAVENGVISMVEMFLESGIDPNAFVEHKRSSYTVLGLKFVRVRSVRQNQRCRTTTLKPRKSIQLL